MQPYFWTFAFSVIWVAIALSPKVRSPAIRFASGVIGVTSVAVLAGIRNDTVGGADTLLYGRPIFEGAVTSHSFSDVVAIARLHNVDSDKGYVFLNYLVSRFSSDVHMFYGVLAFVDAAIILLAIRIAAPMGLGALMWLTYLGTEYCDAFNTLRQGPALALGLLAVALVIRRRPRWGLVAALAGLLFHTSAIFSVFVWAGVALIMRSRRPARTAWMVVWTSLVVLALGREIFHLVGSHLADTKYANYATGAYSGRAVGFSSAYRLVPLLGILMAFRVWRRRGSEGQAAGPDRGVGPGRLGSRPSGALLVTEHVSVEAPSAADVVPATLAIIAMMAAEVILLPLRALSYPLYRVIEVVGYVHIIGYAVIPRLMQSEADRKLATWAMTIFVILYFIIVVIPQGHAQYSSDILDKWMAGL